ncbi:MAG: LytTR family transcriptional regulator DNA-binding domain-containing protein [Bacteroidota bacterium]
MRILLSNHVFIRAADNYLEINYLEGQLLKQKLIRYTLKDIKQDIPSLVQTHRCYLMNFAHFISWNNKNSIRLTLSQIPVSDTFRNSLHVLDKSHHK